MRLCKLCGGFLIVLGILGRLIHYRCESCGMQFSKPLDKEDENESEDKNESIIDTSKKTIGF